MFDEKNENENVFYTAIFGNNIPIDKPEKFDKLEGWDYILFTNFDPSLFDTSWTIIKVEKSFDCNVMCARNIKWNGHPILEKYKKIIWLDAYIKFKKEKKKELDKLYYIMNKNKKDIIFKKHPVRICIYKECDEVVRAKKDTLEKVNINKSILKKEGMPMNYGLAETNIIIYNNNKEVKEFMQKVFNFMIRKSYRDQLSLTYNIWKHKFNKFMFLDYLNIENFITGKPPKSHTPDAYKS